MIYWVLILDNVNNFNFIFLNNILNRDYMLMICWEGLRHYDVKQVMYIQSVFVLRDTENMIFLYFTPAALSITHISTRPTWINKVNK